MLYSRNPSQMAALDSLDRSRGSRPWTPRRLLLAVHRWLGFTAGTIFAIAAGTGAVLVYADELDVLLGGPRFQTTATLLEPDEIQAALARQRPAARVIRVIWPSAGPNILSVRVLENGRPRDLVVDAGSGAVLEPRPQHPLLVAVRRLHAGLLIGETGGSIVIAASCASLASLGLGVILWWPGLRRIASALRLRLGGSLYVSSLDLHQTLGTLALPVLLVMTVTGVLISPSLLQGFSRLVHGTQFTDAWAAVRSASSSATDKDIDFATAARLALAAAPEAAIRQVAFPSMADGIVEVRLRTRGGEFRPVALRIALDRHTGAVLLRQQLRYDPETNSRLHFGLAGGPAVRALYAVACIVGFSLLPTGIAIWWLKRRRPRAAVVRRRDPRLSPFTEPL